MQIPRTAIERLESSRRRLCGLRSAFRVSDVDSPLQALERVSIGAEQILEETNMVGGHHGLLNKRFNYDKYRGEILIWVKRRSGISAGN
jgi:hypothetical protein